VGVAEGLTIKTALSHYIPTKPETCSQGNYQSSPCSPLWLNAFGIICKISSAGRWKRSPPLQPLTIFGRSGATPPFMALTRALIELLESRERADTMNVVCDDQEQTATPRSRRLGIIRSFDLSRVSSSLYNDASPPPDSANKHRWFNEKSAGYVQHVQWILCSFAESAPRTRPSRSA
jgi:hypothetical protein